jgi:hypothetical protein
VDDKKARLAQLAELQRAADAGARFTNARSLRLTEGLKARRFAQIFKYLAQARARRGAPRAARAAVCPPWARCALSRMSSTRRDLWACHDVALTLMSCPDLLGLHAAAAPHGRQASQERMDDTQLGVSCAEERRCRARGCATSSASKQSLGRTDNLFYALLACARAGRGARP